MQDGLRHELEANPTEFFQELPERIDVARCHIAHLVSAQTSGFVFVPNATTAVNAVLRSLRFNVGDQILTTNHAYGACRRALSHVAFTSSVEIVVADIPFPIANGDDVLESILSRVTSKTRLVFLDHVTAPTALVMPIKRLVDEIQAKGIDVLVDGAHAPGMVELSLNDLGAAYYSGNLHKWMCAPKGAGFLYVREDKVPNLHPLTISWGYGEGLHKEFDWTGTFDPTPWLCSPTAAQIVPTIAGADWSKIMADNRSLVLRGREIILRALECDSPCPDAMVGAMAAIPIQSGAGRDTITSGDQVRDHLKRAGFVTMVTDVPDLIVRVSAFLYNSINEYEELAAVLSDMAD